MRGRSLPLRERRNCLHHYQLRSSSPLAAWHASRSPATSIPRRRTAFMPPAPSRGSCAICGNSIRGRWSAWLPAAYPVSTYSTSITSRQDASGGTHAHNTLSADHADVQVFYPFHPLRGAILQILRRPERRDGAVCVIDPAGKRLKIPVWMLLPKCAEITISAQPYLSKQALLSLALLIASHLDSKEQVHDNLLQPAVNGCEGERRAASISGLDDPTRIWRPATGRSNTRRSDRAHGSRSSSGLSRRGGKRQ